MGDVGVGEVGGCMDEGPSFRWAKNMFGLDRRFELDADEHVVDLSKTWVACILNNFGWKRVKIRWLKKS